MRSAAHALALAASLGGPYMPYLRALRGRRDSLAYQTDEQREAAKARAAAKQARKNARRLALRDAAYARRLRAAARQGRVIVVSAEASE